MRNIRKTFSFTMILSGLLIFPIFAKSPSKSKSQNTIRLGILNGPSAIPTAYFFEKPQKDFDLQIQKFPSAMAELPKLLKNEIDIGFLPPNLAAKVYTTNNENLIALGVSGMGNLYLISKDTSVKSLADLKGKSVSVAGQGATPEYMFRYLLAGVTTAHATAGRPTNATNATTAVTSTASTATTPTTDSSTPITLDFSLQTAQIVPALLSGKIDYAVVPEPFATLAEQNGASRILDIQELYGSDYPITLMVCRADFLKENLQTVEKFLRTYKNATDWTVSHPEEAGLLAEKHTLGLKAGIASASIPKANYCWKPAKKSRAAIEGLLQIFLDFAPESIGGNLPDANFYK